MRDRSRSWYIFIMFGALGEGRGLAGYGAKMVRSQTGEKPPLSRPSARTQRISMRNPLPLLFISFSLGTHLADWNIWAWGWHRRDMQPLRKHLVWGDTPRVPASHRIRIFIFWHPFRYLLRLMASFLRVVLIALMLIVRTASSQNKFRVQVLRGSPNKLYRNKVITSFVCHKQFYASRLVLREGCINFGINIWFD